jgi:N-acetylmuramoyl-L-alanine amidase
MCPVNEEHRSIRGQVHQYCQSIAVSAALVLAFTPQAIAGSCKFKDRGDVKIVIDIGHTPSDPGQMSARGVPEFDFNTRLARRVTDEFENAGYRSAQMSGTDVNDGPGLELRAQHANDIDADLFISIHHDGVSDETLLAWQYNGEQRRYLDKFKGYAILVSRKSSKYEESLGFATILADRLIASGLEFTTHHDEQTNTREYGRIAPMVDRARGIYAFDQFVVLYRTNMPALILEAGMIVNRDEEEMLSKPAHSATIAKAVVDAVDKFCVSNAGQRTPDDRR